MRRFPEGSRPIADLCREVVKEINPNLSFEPRANYLILAFKGERLGEGEDFEWLRLEPQQKSLKVSGRSKEREHWDNKLRNLPEPRFRVHGTPSRAAGRKAPHRVRFSGMLPQFENHRGSVGELFAACFWGWCEESGLTSGEISESPTPLPGREVQRQKKSTVSAAELPHRELNSGAGFEHDQQTKKTIEAYAIARAKAEFASLGYRVSPAPESCYDLLCLRGDEELHVEVKGTSSKGEAVNVTENEVQHARDCPKNAVLFVVHSVNITHGEKAECSGGETRTLKPWDPTRGQLRPIAYQYLLPLEGRGLK